MLLCKTKTTLNKIEYPYPEEDQLIEETILYIESLMRRYTRQRSVWMASIILTKLKFLRQCYLDGLHNQSQWACERLIRNWEYFTERQKAGI